MKKSADFSWIRVLVMLTLCGLSAAALLGVQGQITADAELGQPNFTSPTCDNPVLSPSQQLCHPVGVAVNNANGLLFVADGDNNRGLIWPSASGFTNARAASIVLGQPDFNIGHKCSGGTTASTICDPNSAAFDANGNLWVADTDGDRILRFSPPFTNDMPANMVIGQRDLTTSICGNDAETLCHPRDLGFDAFGNLWVVDSDNNRVLVFFGPAEKQRGGLARNRTARLHQQALQPGQQHTPAADTLCGPKGMAFDSSGNLWVAEDDNSRVLEYNDPPAFWIH